jgi:hypothetical protein
MLAAFSERSAVCEVMGYGLPFFFLPKALHRRIRATPATAPPEKERKHPGTHNERCRKKHSFSRGRSTPSPAEHSKEDKRRRSASRAGARRSFEYGGGGLEGILNRGTQGYTGVHRGIQGYTDRGTQGYTWIQRGTKGYTGVHRGTHGYTGVHRGTQGYTGVHRGTQG